MKTTLRAATHCDSPLRQIFDHFILRRKLEIANDADLRLQLELGKRTQQNQPELVENKDH